MSRKRGVHAARNGPSEDRKSWQHIELGIHGLKAGAATGLEKSEKRGVQAAFKVTRAERGHLLSGAREVLLAPTSPSPLVSRSTSLAAGREMGLFSGSIPPWFVLSHNISTINTTTNWLCSGAFRSPPAPSLPNHWPPTIDY